MKYVKGYKHYHNNKYSDINQVRSTFSKIVESNYQDFVNKSKSNYYSDLGKSDKRNIFEISLSNNEYQFLKENMKIDEINNILMESISLTIRLSNDDLINEGLIDGIKKKVSDSYDKAVNWVDDKFDKAVEFGSVAVKKMKDIIASITDIISNLYKQVKSSLTQMWEFLGQQFSKLTEKLKSGFSKAGKAKTLAIVSILEADNMAVEAEEAKKDFSAISKMITGGKLAEQSSVEDIMKGKAEDFKNYSADELEKTVIDDVTTVQAESIVNSLKGLVIENGINILNEVSESLKKGSSMDKINEKGDISAKSIFSWVLEGVSVIISWKSKLIEKLTKVGTNFMMNFMSNVARAGKGAKYVLMGQVVAFTIALIYEVMHLVHEVGGHDVSHDTPSHESKINEDAVEPTPNNDAKVDTKSTQTKQNPNKVDPATKVNPNKEKPEVNTEKKPENEKKDHKNPGEVINNMNLDGLSPDKIITAIDWKSLKFAGLSIVFTLAIKTLLPQLSLLFTIVGVCICSFELIDSICVMSKSHNGICKNIHNIEHFANSLFSKKSATAAH
jgi:DNA-binding protein Fis